MAQAIEVEPIVVKGRTFRPSVGKTTFDQDFFVMDLVSQTAVNKLSVAKGDDLDKIAAEVILNAYRSGNLFRLLAALTVEDGHKWSRPQAEENAVFFSELDTLEDKEAIQEALLGVLLSFFVNAEVFSKTSANFSNVTLEPKEQPKSENPLGGLTGLEVLGMTSSEVLQRTTPMSLAESPDGQSEKDS